MNHSLFLLLGCPLAGFVGMMSGGYWGVGCGWIVVPTLMIMGFNPVEAVGIGLLQMVPSTLPTVIRQTPQIGWGKESVGRNFALPIGIGATLTALLGKPLNVLLNQKFGATFIQWMFVAFIAFIGIQTILSKTRCYNDAIPSGSSRKRKIAFSTGLLTGLLSSLMGIGGGIIIRPLLTSAFMLPEYFTSRIVRLLVLATTFTGAVTYLFHNGAFDRTMFLVGMLIAAGGMAGFPIGAAMHTIVYNHGYAQHIHKSFAVVAVAILAGTLCKIFHFIDAGKIIMLAIAVFLCAYLCLFTLYAAKHPKTTNSTEKQC
ncbi:MAG: sulfite exporter TauE/SafE family protein [Victivallaceae bacterium]|nr:sulfite exporter TauE/SafE family protein [Victivallaceae bacterium]